MQTTFLAKIKYNKELPDSSIKRVSDPFVFEGYTYSHVEERIFTYMEGVKGDVFIDDIKRIKFDRLSFRDIEIEGEEQIFAIAKVAYETLDEATEKKKTITNKILLRGADWKQIEDDLALIIEDVSFDYTDIKIQNLTRTNYMDYVAVTDEEKLKFIESEKEDNDESLTDMIKSGKVSVHYQSAGSSLEDADLDSEEDADKDEDEDEDEY